MNKFLVALCVLVLIATVQPRPTTDDSSSSEENKTKVDVCDNLKPTDSLEGVYHKYKEAHSKQYGSETENEERRQIFENTAKTVIAHNDKFSRGEVTFKMGCNKFADLREDEKPHGGLKRKEE